MTRPAKWRVPLSALAMAVLVLASDLPAPNARAAEGVERRPPGFVEALTEGGIEPDALACNSDVDYAVTLAAEAELAADVVMEKLSPHLARPSDESGEVRDLVANEIMAWTLRTLLVTGDNNNLGVIVLKNQYWTDAEGRRRPLLVFRSGYTPDASRDGSCFRSLLERGGVRHVINLYEGGWLYVTDLDAEERRTAQRSGASYLRTIDRGYRNWRQIIENNPKPGPAWEDAETTVAELIRNEILQPGGKPPRGNIYLHCGGGMHRSGILVGILEKAVNGRSMEEIARAYRYHVGYRDASRPGGFEPSNLEFIRIFDPTLLAD